MSAIVTNVLKKPDTTSLLCGLRSYVPDVQLQFESLAGAFTTGLPWYARMWCAVLLGRTATDPTQALAVLGAGLEDPESHVRTAVLGALARACGRLAIPLFNRVAADRAELGRVRNAAVKAIGKVGCQL